MGWQVDRSRLDALESALGGGSTGAPAISLLKKTAVWDPASLAAATESTTTVAVAGASMGDAVNVGFSTLLPAGVALRGHVSASGVVTVTLRNNTGGAVDLASGTLKVVVAK